MSGIEVTATNLDGEDFRTLRNKDVVYCDQCERWGLGDWEHDCGVTGRWHHSLWKLAAAIRARGTP